MKIREILLCAWFIFTFVSWAVVCTAEELEEVVIGYSGPLSGPAAEYAQDSVNGIDMAINKINAFGGVTVKGKKYIFKLKRLDDRASMADAVSNAHKFVEQDKAHIVFNSLATTIGALLKINETKGSEFLVVGYSSMHKLHNLGNKLLINPTPDFRVFIAAAADLAWEKGYRNGAMIVTLGDYGDAWRKNFRDNWEKKGGKIMGDIPIDYYKETDFSAQITSALANKPDFLLIGGPSATTALAVEQARSMGFKGGFIMIDQARLDFIANTLKNMKLMEGTIGIANIEDIPFPASAAFVRRYKDAYKKAATWESALNYTTMHVIAKAMVIADSVNDPYAIRAAIGKALPLLGDKYPSELFSVEENGVMNSAGIIQDIKNGKFNKVFYTLSFPKTHAAFEKYKKISKTKEPENYRWFPIQ